MKKLQGGYLRTAAGTVPAAGILLLLLFLTCFESFSQCGPPAAADCQAVPGSELALSTAANVDLTFDSFSDYLGGVTVSGATLLRLTVLANNPGACKWILRVYVDNNPGAGTPAAEWETLQTYGLGGAPAPTIGLLQVKVYNGCSTPISSGVYQLFAPAADGSFIDIINDIPLNPAGSCASNVNTEGSFLTNYNEYSFTVDYRVIPGFAFSPGIYQLAMKFCLVED